METRLWQAWLKNILECIIMKYHDLTLRDGCHAISHKLTENFIKTHCKFAEETGIEVIEIGHGNGLGASCLTLGQTLLPITDMIRIARQNIIKTKLSVHIIPGVATIKRDIDPIIDQVDIFRVASHSTEASMTRSHIEYLKSKEKTVYGVLMMSSSCSISKLVEEACKMVQYGASAIIIMDSSGSFLPCDVGERVGALKKLGVEIGFHGHNNLGLAVANSLEAIKMGATIIDCTIRGFGAGAGNTPLEIMNLIKPSEKINTEKVLNYSEKFEYDPPSTNVINMLTAKYKLFSGFEKPIAKACSTYNTSVYSLVLEISKAGLIAGQDDLIEVIAREMSVQ